MYTYTPRRENGTWQSWNDVEQPTQVVVQQGFGYMALALVAVGTLAVNSLVQSWQSAKFQKELERRWKETQEVLRQIHQEQVARECRKSIEKAKRFQHLYSLRMV